MESSIELEDNYFINRTLPISGVRGNLVCLQSHLMLSPNDLNHLQTLLFPDNGITLLEWNDRFQKFEEIMASHV